MALLGGLHLPSLQSRSHDISSICPSQKWSNSGGKVRESVAHNGKLFAMKTLKMDSLGPKKKTDHIGVITIRNDIEAKPIRPLSIATKAEKEGPKAFIGISIGGI